jgi:hypothetical protein
MKATAKTTAGIVIVAAIVVTAVVKGPKWEHKAEVWHYGYILERLTPAQAVELCGKPVLDERETKEGTIRRRMIVRNNYSLAVELDFESPANEAEKWKLAGIQDPSGEIKYESRESQIGVLPCLDKKEK